MILKAPSKLGYSVSLYYLHKIFCCFSLTPRRKKKGNVLCIKDSEHTKVNIFILNKIITRGHTSLEGNMKSSLKCTFDIQPKHMNLPCTLHGLQKWSSCLCNVVCHKKFSLRVYNDL